MPEGANTEGAARGIYHPEGYYFTPGVGCTKPGWCYPPNSEFFNCHKRV